MTKHSIHWICPAPSPYQAFFFSELKQDPEVSLEVHFLEEALSSHPWKRKPEMPFKHRVVNGYFGVDFRLFRLALDPANRFVVAGWNKGFLILFMLWLILLRRDFLFWSDTPNLTKKRSVLKAILRRVVAAIVFRYARQVLGTGQPGVDAFVAMGCPVNKVQSFPYVTRLTDYDPVCKEISDDHPITVVSVGRLVNAVKGFDIGIKALAQLKRSGSARPFTYLICGSGPDLSVLENQVHESGLGGEVRFLGWLEPENVTRILEKAHILLHPALWEPFGVAILEAMVNGVVVLGSEATCAVRDRITDGRNGFSHAVGDVNQLAEQLALLFNDLDRLHAMGAAARQTAEQWPASRGVAIIKRAFEGKDTSYQCAE
jgi:glycosyltransferase involved in cell wall biosynthesis